MEVTLLGGSLTANEMQRYVDSLVDIYARNWVHKNANLSAPRRFIQIEARGSPTAGASAFSSGETVLTTATFVVKANRDPDNEQDDEWLGFHCSVASGHIVGQTRSSDYEVVWKHHRCQHATIDPPVMRHARRPWFRGWMDMPEEEDEESDMEDSGGIED